jgi:hypothetical protein
MGSKMRYTSVFMAFLLFFLPHNPHNTHEYGSFVEFFNISLQLSFLLLAPMIGLSIPVLIHYFLNFDKTKQKSHYQLTIELIITIIIFLSCLSILGLAENIKFLSLLSEVIIFLTLKLLSNPLIIITVIVWQFWLAAAKDNLACK